MSVSQKMHSHDDFGEADSQLSISYFYAISMIWFGYSNILFPRDTWDESIASPWPQSHHLQWLCAWTFTGDANPLFVKGEQTLAEKILGMPQAWVFFWSKSVESQQTELELVENGIRMAWYQKKRTAYHFFSGLWTRMRHTPPKNSHRNSQKMGGLC